MGVKPTAITVDSVRSRMKGAEKKKAVQPNVTAPSSGPRILTLDIETLPALLEKFDLKPGYISAEWVVVPTRVLCFAAKWYGDENVIFRAAWDDDDAKSYDDMAREAWNLFDQADVIVGWNSTRFDIKHLQAAFGRLGLGPPSPSRSLDLMTVARKNFQEMSYRLDWFSKRWLDDAKIKHDGVKMWQDIRRGNDVETARAKKLFREYNIKDIMLTERLFEKFRAWTGVNFALLDPNLDDNGRMTVCPRCQSSSLQSRGKALNTNCAYDRYRCNDCGGWSRGRRMTYSTELRPI